MKTYVQKLFYSLCSSFITLFVSTSCTLGKMDIKIEELSPSTETPPSLSIAASGTSFSVSEGSSIVFVFNLDTASSKDSIINIKLEPVSNDLTTSEVFQNVPSTFTIAAGEKTKSFSLQSIDDNYFDARDRKFKLSFTSKDLNTEENQFDITITENEAVPVISFTALTGNANENIGSSTATVTMTPASKQSVSVAYSFVNQTATNATDYNATDATLTFAALESTKTIPFTIIDDSTIDSGETFQITLGTITGPGTTNNNKATLGTKSTKTITIVDNDYPSISITDATVDKGNTISFTVSLSVASSQAVTVDWTTANDSGLSGTHYTANSGSLIFSAGQTSKTITLNTTNFAGVCTSDKSFFVNLSNASNASLSDNQGIGTIQDPSRPSLTIADTTIAEGATLSLTATLSQACTGKTVSFNYATANGTATAGSDYTANSGTASITSGTTSTTITVVTAQDSIYEGDETFTVSLSNLTNATAGTTSATITITDDETQPTLSWTTSSSSVLENVGTVTLTAQLSGASSTSTSASINLTGTATNTTDYSISPTSISIAAGSTSQSVTITIVDDAVVESTETIILTLASPSGASLGTTTANTITVGDNDKALAIYPATLVLNPSESYTFNATGGTGGYTYTVISASGGSFGTAGAYTAPTSAGTYTVRVTDSFANTSDASVIILDSENDTDLNSYFRADKITNPPSSGSALTNWDSWRNNSIVLTQATAAYKPLYVTNQINSKPVVRFDGTNDNMIASASTFIPASGAGTRTVIHVIANAVFNPSGSNPVSSWGTNSSKGGYGLSANLSSDMNRGSSGLGTFLYGYESLTSADHASNYLAGLAPIIVTQTYNGSTDKIYVNGNLISATDYALTTGTNFYFRVGRDTRTATYYNGDIAEVLTSNLVLTDAKRESMECMLGFRYNISIYNSTCAAGALTLSSTDYLVKVNGSLTLTASGGVPPYSFSVVSGGGSTSTLTANTATYTAGATASNVVAKVTDNIGNISTINITVLNHTAPKYWMVADSLNASLADSASVTTWKDYYNRNDQFTQITSTKQPLLKKNILNGHSVVRFDGVNDELRSGILPALGAAAREIMVVIANGTMTNVPATIFTYGWDQTSLSGFSLMFVSGKRSDGPYIGGFFPSGGTYQHVHSSVKSTADAMILNLSYDGSTPKIYLNGTLTGTSPITTTLATTKIRGLTLGYGDFYEVNPFKGDIVEVLVFDSTLSDADRKTISCNLSSTYNISSSNGSCNTGAIKLTSTGNQKVGPSETKTFSAEGGTPPYTFSLVSGEGSIDPNTGVYTATSNTGTTNRIRVTDSLSNSAEQDIDVLTFTTPQFWMATDSVTQADATSLVYLPDLSGNNNYLWGHSDYAPTYKTNMVNGKPYLLFNSVESNYLLTGYTPPTGSANRTIIAVYADADTNKDGSDSRLLYGYGQDYGNAFGFIPVHAASLKMYLAANTYIGGTNATSTTATIVETTTSSGSGYLYINGSLDTSGTITGLNTSTGYTLRFGGGWWSGSGRYQGGLLETIAFDKAISAGERTTIVNYLKAKYNIP